MFNKQITTIALVMVFVSFCPTSRGDDNAQKLVVGQPDTPCPNAQYSTIGAAISAASPGDEIDICPALYLERLTITKPITLRGVGENGVQRVLLRPALGNVGGLRPLRVLRRT